MLVAQLDRNFQFRAMGLDNGGNGIAVIQNLRTLTSFSDLPNLDDRLEGFDFGGTTLIDKTDGKETKESTKKLMTNLINGAARGRTAIWPKQDEISEDQYTSQTYVLTERGNVVYSKGNDHVIDADRCAFIMRETILRLREIAGGFTEGEFVGAINTEAIF